MASQKEEEGKKNGEEGKEKGEEGKKEGKGKKKDAQGREENIFKGAGEGFQQYYVLKTFPSTLKDEVKGRKYFQRRWGRFSTMLCLENLPQHLKR